MNKFSTLPVFSDIQQATQRIANYAHRTPIHTSNNLNTLLGNQFFFKCENFQRVGAFKFRGACNAVFSLNNDKLKNGVATHSSGNHAAALALAAQLRGVKSYIVMPDNASEVKKIAVENYGGNIIFCEPTLVARETTLQKVVEQTGATMIHPYNNPYVMAGQGTAAFELCTDVTDLDIVMCPVGGGGLLSGTALAVKNINPRCKVVAAEPEQVNDAYISLKQGSIAPPTGKPTLADGLLTSLGELPFQIIRQHVDDIVTVSEEAMVQAMRLVWERMKIIIEPSSAVPLAAFVQNKVAWRDKKIGIILSGGNVDVKKLPF